MVRNVKGKHFLQIFFLLMPFRILFNWRLGTNHYFGYSLNTFTVCILSKIKSRCRKNERYKGSTKNTIKDRQLPQKFTPPNYKIILLGQNHPLSIDDLVIHHH